VARGQGAGSAAIEGGFEGGEFLHAAVGSQVVVPGDAVVAEDEIVEESFGIGGGTLEMAFEGQLVLLLTGDVPFPGHELTMLAHGKAGAGFPVCGWLWCQFGKAESL